MHSLFDGSGGLSYKNQNKRGKRWQPSETMPSLSIPIPHSGPKSRVAWLGALNANGAGPVLVVLSWSYSLGTLWGVQLPPLHLFLLGSAIWMGYMADRWCDVRHPDTRIAELAPRHHWVLTKQRWILPVWLAILFLSLALSLLYLRPTEWGNGSLLAILCLVYTVGTAFFRGRYFSKEWAVSLLLLAAVGFFSRSFLWVECGPRPLAGYLPFRVQLLPSQLLGCQP